MVGSSLAKSGVGWDGMVRLTILIPVFGCRGGQNQDSNSGRPSQLSRAEMLDLDDREIGESRLNYTRAALQLSIAANQPMRAGRMTATIGVPSTPFGGTVRP